MYDALEIYGDAIDAYDEANLAYSRTRDTELETRDNLLEAQDRLDEVTELLESTPQIDPTDPDVLALYAIVTVRQHELELAQADYEQAQENTKDMKDALDEEMENLADKKEDLETRATFESIWRGEGWSTWFAMHAVIRNVETFTSFILPSDTFADWAKNIDKIFANDVLSVEHRTSTICEQAFDREPASGALISTGDIGYATAAHIEGWRSEPIRIDDNSRIYDYVITGSVYSPKESGLKFEVYANPGNKKILNEVQIEDGEEWYIFNEETALNFTSEEEYNEICIKFTNSEWDLRDYFDEIPDNNQVCNYITGE